MSFKAGDAVSAHSEWWVAEDYRIEKGIVVPTMAGKTAPQWEKEYLFTQNRYSPMEYPELPGEFAKLIDKSEDTILTFIRRYGLLGFYESREVYETLGISAYEPGKIKAGDPLPWIIKHAETVNLALSLHGCLVDEEKLENEIHLLKHYDSEYEDFEVKFSYAERMNLYPTEGSIFPLPDSNREIALRIISTMVNANIIDFKRELQIEQGDTDFSLNTIFKTGNLLGAIYWHLADAVEGNSIKRCEYSKCRKFFVALNPRTKYCPAPKDYKGISPCANRARVEKCRAHKHLNEMS